MISLKATRISKTYADSLLQDVNLTHSGKGIVAFIGDNGSGKSTFLKMLSGDEVPDSGTIEWSEVQSIGTMPQEIISDISLSGGQKKMAVLSDLLFSNRDDVLLLDEPDNHLDLDNKLWLEEYLPLSEPFLLAIKNFVRSTKKSKKVYFTNTKLKLWRKNDLKPWLKYFTPRVLLALIEILKNVLSVTKEIWFLILPLKKLQLLSNQN